MLNGTLIKTSLVDYPTRVAATYFLSGCNIRCPYCYNGELVLGQITKTDLVSIEDVYTHLKARKNVLSGFVISGGEPLLYPEIPSIIQTAKSLGYSVKLDTNGLFPDRLIELFNSENTTPDYIAIDVKTNPLNYTLLQCNENALDLLTRSIQIIKKLPTEQREFRTVLCPPLISKKDIDAIAQLLPEDARWFFAQFRNDHCLDVSYNNIQPYSDKELAEIIEYAKNYIPNSSLR